MVIRHALAVFGVVMVLFSSGCWCCRPLCGDHSCGRPAYKRAYYGGPGNCCDGSVGVVETQSPRIMADVRDHR